MAETATETTTETPVLRSAEEREAYQAWENYYSQRGEPIPRRTIFQNVLRDITPPVIDHTDTAQRRENLLQPGGMGSYIPERPDVPRDRDLSPVEQDIWRINRDKVLEATGKDAYTKPPGERVDFSTLKKDEYGWSDEDTSMAQEVLRDTFQMDSSSVERAVDALLLAGYTANDVIKKVTSSRVPINELGSMGAFKNVFSDPHHMISNNTAKLVFAEEAFEREKQGYGGDPQTMEDLAWRLSRTGAKGGPTGEWMTGKHAMFEARMKTKEERDTDIREKGDHSWGKYYVNENSFLHWFRDELDVLWDIWGPNTPIQPMTQVQSRVSNLNVIRLQEMIEKQEAFKSEDGKTKYLQLWLKLQLEPSTFQTLYDNDIIYRQSMVNLDKWMERYEETTFMNPLTKLGFRTNIIQQLLLGTNEYQEGRAKVDGGKYLSDNKLGGAFSEMVLAFYNLGDFDELKRVLGPESSFFTREGWITAMEGVAYQQAMRPGGGIKLSPDERKAFDKAFDEGTGKIKDEKEFITFINTLNTSNLPGSHLELFVTRAISDSVQKRFDLKDAKGFSLVVAEAWFFNRFMGGNARNDIQMAHYTDKNGKDFYTPNPSVHDKPSELFNMGANREKYASKGGGKPYGNLQTIGQFKASAIDPMVGVVTMEDVPVYDAFGNPVKGQKMKKSLLGVINEAHDLQVGQQERIQSMKQHLENRHLAPASAAYKAAMDQIDAEEKVQSRIYQHYVADNAAFHENAHREYVQVHLKAAKQFTERIMKGEGLDFNEFTGYDAWGGPTIKREVLSQQLQKNILGLARDMVKKYKWMNFNEDVRVPYYNRETGEYGFRDGKLGERMFGYDLLNRKEFWMKDERGKPIKENGLHVIDYNKVNDSNGRVLLMKEMFMTEIAGDMFSHQKLNSGDKRFNPMYYLNMLEVLKTMPGKLLVDEFAKHGITVSESFFTKEDFKWLEARALNGNVLGIPMGKFGFYLKWWLSSLSDKTDKEGSGFGRMLSMFLKGITSGF